MKNCEVASHKKNKNKMKVLSYHRDVLLNSLFTTNVTAEVKYYFRSGISSH